MMENKLILREIKYQIEQEMDEHLKIPSIKNGERDLDISDIGNIIGIAIGKYIQDHPSSPNKQDFISGIKHGISLIDGTH